MREFEYINIDLYGENIYWQIEIEIAYQYRHI